MSDNGLGWVKDNGSYYYYYSNRKMATGWQKLDGDTYYFYNDGSMAWGRTIDGYYVNNDGKWVTSEGWQKNEKGIYYYVGSDEKAATGWENINNNWYYFDDDGKMGTGWQNIDGFWYYLYSSGEMATSWVETKNGWYYLYANGSMTYDNTVGGYHLDSSGKMVTGTGWQESDGSWYYLKDDGSVATDWLYNQGNWYFLYSKGSMAHATWVDGYYLDDNGEWKSNMDNRNTPENIDSSNSQNTHNTYEEPRWNDEMVNYIKGSQRYQWLLKGTQDGDGNWAKFFDVGGFDRDENGVYHAKQDAIVQSRAGYNDFYDDTFDLACSMNKEKFEFETSSGKYIIWIWKGDYFNFGAGAEIGIYKGGGPWWGCDIEDAMPMTLRLEEEGNTIFDWKPPERNWWCTGFNPDYQNRQEQNLIAYGSIDFSKHLDMWDAFYERCKKEPIWNLKQKPIAKFKW